MSTKSIIDRVIPYAPRWERSTGQRNILRLIEEAEDELMNIEIPIFRFIDYTNNQGFPPYLTTTAGTYKYEITAANLTNYSSLTQNVAGTDYTVRARKVGQVFIDVTEFDYDKKWLGRPYIYYFPNPYTTNITRSRVGSVPVDSTPALENTPAYITFKEDPGTTSQQYFVEFYFEAPRLTSENIPIMVNKKAEKLIEYYILGRIQMFENGKPNEWMAMFEAGKNKWQQEMTEGAQSDSEQVQPVNC